MSMVSNYQYQQSTSQENMTKQYFEMAFDKGRRDMAREVVHLLETEKGLAHEVYEKLYRLCDNRIRGESL